MQLQTPVSLPTAPWQITYTDHILLLGSCFSDSMAERFHQHYFQVTANPFGTLYNPLSILQCLERLQSATPLTESDLIHHDGLYHAFTHHSDYSHENQQQALQILNQSIADGHKALREANVVIITLGTAWVYTYQGVVVANCHKLPAASFERRRISVSEVEECIAKMLTILQGKRVLFSVSPIRHIKDGLHENQLSKATLLLGIEQALKHAHRLATPSSAPHPTSQNTPDYAASAYFPTYFPAYEIVLDELRDYRFFADDLVHPSSMTADYIWEKFAQTYFSASVRDEMRPLHQLYLDLHHRPLHANSEAYRHFEEHTRNTRDLLRQKYPWI